MTTSPNTPLPPWLRRWLLTIQKDEITEYRIYLALAERCTDQERTQLLRQLAQDELRHYQFWKSFTGEEVPPSRWRIWLYTGLARLFPLTFVLKLMERGESASQARYHRVAQYLPQAQHIIQEEQDHEEKLLNLIDEPVLHYLRSIALGMNDALVEMLGILSGLVQVFQDNFMVALLGFLSGSAATLSMASAEYLSTKEEVGSGRRPGYAALFTGFAYLLVVAILILPFLLDWLTPLGNLVSAIGLGILILAFFNFFSSILHDRPFWRSYIEKVGIVGGVTLITSLLGWALRIYFGVDLP